MGIPLGMWWGHTMALHETSRNHLTLAILPETRMVERETAWLQGLQDVWVAPPAGNNMALFMRLSVGLGMLW